MATSDDLPGFMRSQLGSVWALELLLLLRKSPQRAFTVGEAVAELRASTGLVEANLARFRAAGLVVEDGDARYRYAPASQILCDLCDLVEDTYRSRPVWTINLISTPADRLQQLADAFRLKGPRDD